MARPNWVGHNDVGLPWMKLMSGVSPTLVRSAMNACHISGATAMQYWEKTKLSPAASERTIGMMSRSKVASSGLGPTSSGSFHLVMAPVKMPHAARRVSFRSLMRWPESSRRLYMKDRPPEVTGTYT